ncbi:putative dehydrogenase [Hydrogenispora ethanolica]|uniref:Putative dehydrogenase n=1 Tax=Hydrogenispora ethanolica TaxID=1082276 RepID=A0A4R1RWR9_HYDET|nr:Gfo/Idh/MocA family oxidoreductase [Hydrogenispora ethanolica]TCL70904.1 putative dehydrogenase [Hydrogenispora ethanolica]
MRFAIAGAQHFHLLDLLQTMRSFPDIEWVGVCHAHPNYRRLLAEEYRLPIYDSLGDLLEQAQPEAVACFDAFTERTATIAACLRRGIHVLADKPPAISFDQLAELEEAFYETRSLNPAPVLAALFSERYNPPVLTLKRLIATGTIGPVVNFTAFRPHKLKKGTRPEWMFRRRSYGGILVDLTVHDLDVYHWLTGRLPVAIMAAHSNFSCPEYPEFEDNGQIFFTAADGSAGFIKTEWLAPEAFPSHGDCRYFVTGTRGTVEVHTGGDITDRDGKVVLCTHDQPPVQVPLVRPDHDLYADFLCQCRGIATPGAPMIQATELFATLRTVLTARDAADQQKRLSLTWPESG